MSNYLIVPFETGSWIRFEFKRQVQRGFPFLAWTISKYMLHARRSPELSGIAEQLDKDIERARKYPEDGGSAQVFQVDAFSHLGHMLQCITKSWGSILIR
jgi:hypothetical protein